MQEYNINDALKTLSLHIKKRFLKPKIYMSCT